MFLKVNTRPRLTGVDTTVHAAAYLAALIGVTYEDFVDVAGIDQDAGEVAERQVTAAASPS